MAGAPPVGLGTYHTDDTFQVHADDTAIRSTFLVAAFGPSCWSPGTHHTDDTFRVRAGRHCSSDHTPCLGFWSHQFPARWSKITLQRNCPSPTHQSCLVRALPACCTAHLRELPVQAPWSAIDLYFFAFGNSEAYARHATDKHTRINPSNDHRRGLRLLGELIGQHTPLLSVPDRPVLDPLGIRAPCSRSSCRGSLLVVLPGKEQAALVEWAFSFGEFFQYTRYRMGFSTYVHPSCASHKLLLHFC